MRFRLVQYKNKILINIFMKFISKIYFPLIGIILTANAMAADVVPNPLKAGTFTELITSIADFLLSAGMALATLMILYGGFQYVTSGGDENKVKSAHQTLTWAIVGLTILIVGKGLVFVIQGIILGESSQNTLVLGAIERIVQFFYQFVLAIAVIMIIYAGYLFMGSGGDPTKLQEAKKYLTYAIVGIMVTVLAYSVSGVVRSILGQ